MTSRALSNHGGKSGGNPAVNFRSASTAPAEPPITMMSLLASTPLVWVRRMSNGALTGLRPGRLAHIKMCLPRAADQLKRYYHDTVPGGNAIWGRCG